MPERDPIQRADDGSRDLVDVVYWEPRSRIDGLSVRLHGTLVASVRAVLVLFAGLIVLSQFLLTGLVAAVNPVFGAFVLLSVVPALGLAVYVWRVDVTIREPARTLVVTFLLGFLFAGFAAVLNSSLGEFFGGAGLGLVLSFFLVVGPVEETVKWLAVRLHAYRTASFDAVVDGAVYGAVAGLGFATIENAVYIASQSMEAMEAGLSPLEATFGIAAVRTLAGPGHVLYSAFAGYYLGLAKFNPEDRGPIVVKGLLVAALLHATYNTLASSLPLLAALFPPVRALGPGGAFVALVAVFDGLVGYALYRKLARYRSAYRASGADRYRRDIAGDATVDRTEFDPPAVDADD